MPDDQPRDRLNDRTRRLHDHLEATAELPLDRTASRWIGEAEAVARDVATNDLDAETTRDRVAKVRELLSEVGDTGDEAVDEHLEAARRCCDEVLEVEDR
ncbi:hypothetical protein [Halopiger aswanensis]|uniref:hypothetical protein n=1 Tax=Halopiger aswanensis TaxID=148449 RepID=UPI000E753A6C|nr:hypothetical protein [Halopiger aswanensis]